MGYDDYGFRPYVSVGKRRQQAKAAMAKLEKKGMVIQPITIEGRKIAKTFWGQAWCDHLESFSDYSNRLPRGRTYVRNGSVCHLAIKKGNVEAKVSGSEIYNVKVNIQTLPKKKWTALKSQCTGQIGSLLELLSGQLSEGIMEVVTDKKQGLFPLPGEIKFDCDCPDWAGMCKHIAAVMYGVGSRLDHEPGLLFELRGVDVEELIEADAEHAITGSFKTTGGKQLGSEDLSDIFGIDMAPSANSSAKKSKKKSKTSRSSSPSKTSKTSKKKAVKKRTAKTSAKKKTAKPKKKATPSAKKKAVKKKTAKVASAKKKTAKKKAAKKKTTKRKSAKKKTS